MIAKIAKEMVYEYKDKKVYYSLDELEKSKLGSVDIPLTLEHTNDIIGKCNNLRIQDGQPVVEVEFFDNVPSGLVGKTLSVSPVVAGNYIKSEGVFNNQKYNGHLENIVWTELAIVLGDGKCPMEFCNISYSDSNESNKEGIINNNILYNSNMSENKNASDESKNDKSDEKTETKITIENYNMMETKLTEMTELYNGMVEKELNQLKKQAIELGHDEESLKDKSKDYMTGFINGVPKSKPKIDIKTPALPKSKDLGNKTEEYNPFDFEYIPEYKPKTGDIK